MILHVLLIVLMVSGQLSPSVASVMKCSMRAVRLNETAHLICHLPDRQNIELMVKFTPKGSNKAEKIILSCKSTDGDMQCGSASLPFGNPNYVKTDNYLTLEARGSGDIEGKYTCMPVPSNDGDFQPCTFELDTRDLAVAPVIETPPDTTAAAPTTEAPSKGDSVTTATTPANEASSGNTGSIVGTVLGIVGVLVILVVAWKCSERFRKRVTDCFPCLKQCPGLIARFENFRRKQGPKEQTDKQEDREHLHSTGDNINDKIPGMKVVEQSTKGPGETEPLMTTVSADISQLQETDERDESVLTGDDVVPDTSVDIPDIPDGNVATGRQTPALPARPLQTNTVAVDIHKTDTGLSHSGVEQSKQQFHHHNPREHETKPAYSTHHQTADGDRSGMEANGAAVRATSTRDLQKSEALVAQIHPDPSRRLSYSGTERTPQGFCGPSQGHGTTPVSCTKNETGLVSSPRSFPEDDCHGSFSKSKITAWIRDFTGEVSSKQSWKDLEEVQMYLHQAWEPKAWLDQQIKLTVKRGIFSDDLKSLQNLLERVDTVLHILKQHETNVIENMHQHRALQRILSESSQDVNQTKQEAFPPLDQCCASDCARDERLHSSELLSPTGVESNLNVRKVSPSPVPVLVTSPEQLTSLLPVAGKAPSSHLEAKGSSQEHGNSAPSSQAVHQNGSHEDSSYEGHVGNSDFSPAHDVDSARAFFQGQVPMTEQESRRKGRKPSLKLETGPSENIGISPTEEDPVTPVNSPSRENPPPFLNFDSSAHAHSISTPNGPQGQPGGSSTAARSSICMESPSDGASQHTTHADGMKAGASNLTDKDGKQTTGTDFSPTVSNKQLPGSASGLKVSNGSGDNPKRRGSARLEASNASGDNMRLEASNGSGNIHEKRVSTQNNGLPQMATHQAEGAVGKHTTGSAPGTGEATLLGSGTVLKDKSNKQLPVEDTGHSTLGKEEGGYTEEHEPAVSTGQDFKPAKTTSASGNMLTTDSESTEHLNKEESTDEETASKSGKESVGENEEGLDQKSLHAVPSHKNSCTKVKEGSSCQDDANQGTGTVVDKDSVRDMKFLKAAKVAFEYAGKNITEKKLKEKMFNEFEEYYETCYSSVCPKSRRTLTDVLNTSVYEKNEEQLLIAILCNACKCTVQIFYPKGDQEQCKIKMHSPCREGVQSETDIYLRVHYTGEYCHFSPTRVNERS